MQFPIAHVLVSAFFNLLIFGILVWIILSWLPIGHGNPIVRFFDNLTGPLIEPIRRRLPRLSLGMFDVTTMIAVLFVWWALSMLNVLIQSALPAGW